MYFEINYIIFGDIYYFTRKYYWSLKYKSNNNFLGTFTIKGINIIKRCM